MTNGTVPPGMEDCIERFDLAPGVLVGHMIDVSGQLGRDDAPAAIAGEEARLDRCFRNIGKVPDVIETWSWRIDFPDDWPGIAREAKVIAGPGGSR